jgi:hypothetical protein
MTDTYAFASLRPCRSVADFSLGPPWLVCWDSTNLKSIILVYCICNFVCFQQRVEIDLMSCYMLHIQRHMQFLCFRYRWFMLLGTNFLL